MYTLQFPKAQIHSKTPKYIAIYNKAAKCSQHIGWKHNLNYELTNTTFSDDLLID